MNDYETSEKYIVDFYSQKGFSPIIVSGLMGNYLTEDPPLRGNNAQNGVVERIMINGKPATDETYTQAVDDGTYTEFATDRVGYGLAQWTSAGRKQGLLDLVKSLGASISNLGLQCEYGYREITRSKTLMDKLSKASSPEEAAVILMVDWERPAKKDDPDRQKVRANRARMIYNKYFAINEEVPMKTLAISCGHWMGQSGKRCAKELDSNETREWWLNQRIGVKLIDKLSKYQLNIIRLDDPTGETFVTLADRAKKSDAANADFYLAIHHNATNRVFGGGGISVYHYPTQRNQNQATDLYNRLIQATGLKGNRSCPVNKTTELYEVRVPKADAILVEHGFMTSTVDVPIILSEEFAGKCAQAEFEFFKDMWNLQPKQIVDTTASRIAEIKAQIAALTKELEELGGSL